jgi:hypothetical protein
VAVIDKSRGSQDFGREPLMIGLSAHLGEAGAKSISEKHAIKRQDPLEPRSVCFDARNDPAIDALFEVDRP